MKKEFFFNLVFTISISLIGFIQNKYFVECLGIEILGILKLFNQLFQYLNIVEMGIGSASAYALYKPLAEKNIDEISKIVSTIKSIYNKIAIILFGLGLFCTPLLPFFMKVDNFNRNIYLYWLLFLINTISTYLYIKYVILFTADQQFIKVKFIQSSSKIFYQILQIIFLMRVSSLYIYIFLLLLDNLTQYIFFKIYYNKRYSYIYTTKERYLGIKSDIKNLFWHKVGGLIVFNTDLILISKLVSIETVGIYASYMMVFQILKTIINILYSVLTPKIGKYIAQNDKENIYKSFKEINIVFILLGMLLIFPTFKLINIFIKLWIGKEFILGNWTIVLMCINYYIDLVRWILEAYKTGAGFFDDIQSPILEAIINLVFSIILGIKYGLDGIIIGTIISNILVIMIYKPILVFKRCFDKGVKEYIKIYGNYLILLVISLALLNIATKPFIRTNINTWIDWVIYATTISIITGVVLFIVFLLNKEFRNVIKTYVLKRK